MNEVARKLLDAHVAFELERLAGAGLDQLLAARIGEIFEWLSDVPLEDVVPRENVTGAIARYVIELKVSGGITELTGEMARMVLSSRGNDSFSLRDVLSDRSFEDFTDKIFALEGVRHEVISLVAHSASLRELVARAVSHVIADALRRGTLRMSPSASLSTVVERSLLPGLEQRTANLLARQLEKYGEIIGQQLEHHLVDTLDASSLRALADELWRSLAGKRLDEVFALLGEQDLEDFVVFCLEFWLRFRESPYLKHTLNEGVQTFYGKYGAESVTVLIEDMGVTREMIIRELQTMLAPMLAQARATGFLEQQLRAVLGAFYESALCAEVLAE